MVRFTVAAFALLVGCGGQAQVDKPIATTPGDSNKVEKEDEGGDWIVDPNQAAQLFEGPDGARIELVPVRSKSDPELKHQNLLRATRSHSDYDGMVVRVERKETINRIHYIAYLRGAPFVLLHRFRSSKSSWNYTGYNSTGHGQKVKLLDQSFDANAVLLARETQSDSKLHEIEPPDRAGKQAAQAKRFAKSLAEVQEDCGKLEASIDWSSVEDSWFDEFSVSSACWNPLSAMEHFCEAHPKQAPELMKTVSLTCRFQGRPEDVKDFGFEQESPGKFVYRPGKGSYQIRSIRAQLRRFLGEDRQVYRLGDQHFIKKYGEDDLTLFAQDDKTYFPVTESASPDSLSFSLPSGAVKAEFNFRRGQWHIDCGRKQQTLELLLGAERKAILDSATFEAEEKWKRTPYFLSRDSHGTYYYVDRYMKRYGGKRYRVFVGRRGQLKLTKLKRLVEDSEGTLFSTAKGDLRLVVNSGTKTAVWIQGKKQTPLTPVGIHKNRKLIYDELGVYFGAEMGLVCE